MVDLRREFENPCPALKTVASRTSRGVYRRDRRPLEPSVVDSRGRIVRAVGRTQTFLSPAQVDELVALNRTGLVGVSGASLHQAQCDSIDDDAVSSCGEDDEIRSHRSPPERRLATELLVTS